MAQELYATNNFVGNGSTTAWTISFADGYLSKADVKARYFDASGDAVDIPVTGVAGSVVTISPAIANGLSFQIYRDTQKSGPLVDYSDGAILNEENLDQTTRQAVMVAAEAWDLSFGTRLVAQQSLGEAAAATLAAAAAQAAAATASAQAEASAQSAASAAGASQAAQSAASQAQSTADGAVVTANAAKTTADSAKTASDSAVLAVGNKMNISGGIFTGSAGITNSTEWRSDYYKPFGSAGSVTINFFTEPTATYQNLWGSPAVNGNMRVRFAKRASADTESALEVRLRTSAGAEAVPFTIDYQGYVQMGSAGRVNMPNDTYLGTTRILDAIAAASASGGVSDTDLALPSIRSGSNVGQASPFTISGSGLWSQSAEKVAFGGCWTITADAGTALTGSVVLLINRPSGLSTFTLNSGLVSGNRPYFATGWWHPASGNPVPIALKTQSTQSSGATSALWVEMYRTDTHVTVKQNELTTNHKLILDGIAFLA